jgi:hypothetical protein
MSSKGLQLVTTLHTTPQLRIYGAVPPQLICFQEKLLLTANNPCIRHTCRPKIIKEMRMEFLTGI